MTDHILICPGEVCPLRFTCLRWQKWLNNEDEDADEMIPDYHNGGCRSYEQKPYYGQ